MIELKKAHIIIIEIMQKQHPYFVRRLLVGDREDVLHVLAVALVAVPGHAQVQPDARFLAATHFHLINLIDWLFLLLINLIDWLIKAWRGSIGLYSACFRSDTACFKHSFRDDHFCRFYCSLTLLRDLH